MGDAEWTASTTWAGPRAGVRSAAEPRRAGLRGAVAGPGVRLTLLAIGPAVRHEPGRVPARAGAPGPGRRTWTTATTAAGSTRAETDARRQRHARPGRGRGPGRATCAARSVEEPADPEPHKPDYAADRPRARCAPSTPPPAFAVGRAGARRGRRRRRAHPAARLRPRAAPDVVDARPAGRRCCPTPHAHFLGENPQHVYSVRFDSARAVGGGRRAVRPDRRAVRELPGEARMTDLDPDRDSRRAAHRGARAAAHRARPGRPEGDRTVHRQLRDARRPAERRQGRRQGVDRPGVQARLLDDGTAAIKELGFGGAAGRAHRRRGEHPAGPQRRGLHAVLLLPVAGARAAAGLVQGPGLPRAGGARAARGARRDGPRARPTTSRSRCGTPAARCATWCCPSARPAPRSCPRRSSRRWSRATHGRRGQGRGAVTARPLDVDGPGRAAALQRRAGVRRAVGEPGVRPGRRPVRGGRVRPGRGSRRALIARIAAWEADPAEGEPLELLPSTGCGRWRTCSPRTARSPVRRSRTGSRGWSPGRPVTITPSRDTITTIDRPARATVGVHEHGPAAAAPARPVHVRAGSRPGARRQLPAGAGVARRPARRAGAAEHHRRGALGGRPARARRPQRGRAGVPGPPSHRAGPDRRYVRRPTGCSPTG